MIKKLIVSAVLLSLTACAGTPVKKVESPEGDMVIASLLSAAVQVRDEMKKMNTESGKTTSAPSSAFSGCSTRIVSIDFDGDIMMFVDDMQKSNICKIRVNGRLPKQDLILSLHHKKVPLWQVLENVGAQLGNMADVSLTREDVVLTFKGNSN